MSATVEFYYFPLSPPSRVVWMVLEEMGLKYEPHVVDIMGGKHKTEEFRKISFRQRVPAIKDGDFCLAESRAVAGYLASQYGAKCGKESLFPQDKKQQFKIEQHLYISENIFEQILGYVNIGGVFFGGEQTKTENIGKAKEGLAQIETMLNDHVYTAADNLTLADFCYYVAVGLLNVVDYDDWAEYPKIVAWKKKMAALPYHKKTCEEPLEKMKAFYQENCKKNAEKKQ